MSFTRIVLATSALALSFPGLAQAEFVGLNIGPGALPSSQPLTSSSIDLVDDLDTANPEPNSMVLILEHPISALPNVRYEGFSNDSTNPRTLNPELRFASGSDIGAGETSYDLEQEDIVLYYQLLNNWIDLDMGVDLKRVDAQVSQVGLEDRIDIDETIPLFHLSARVELPISGLYVGADINANVVDLGLSDSNAQDSTIMLGYQSDNGLGIEGGIKSFSLELNDTGDTSTNFEYDGLFVNGYFNF